MVKFICILVFVLLVSDIQAQKTDLYQVTLIRAAPGRLLELIDLLKKDIEDHHDYGMAEPYLMRHSQGDQWDLLMIYPLDRDLGEHFSKPQISKRRASRTQDQFYNSPYFDLVSFQEEQIVSGPPVDVFNKLFRQYGYYHVEIFRALAGKRSELVRQRQMENVFLREIGRDENLIFTKVIGGEADCFTIGFYRDIGHYAQSADIPHEIEDKAARKAGFESVDTIGSYLRSLLLEHHDTLAGKVSAD
jgi:hypothetical protein